MSYLIDANVFITPYQTYYAFDLVPKFWDFLSEQIKSENILLIDKVYDEIAVNKDKGKPSDDLQKWIERLASHKKSIKTAEIIDAYQEVINYLNDSDKYSDFAKREWFRLEHADPWLVAVARAGGYKIITFETKKGASPKGQGLSAVRIPNVCEDLEIECLSLFDVLRELRFKAL